MQDEKASLAAFLADQDVPCPACGYNLKGLTKQACPECNQPLALRVGQAKPKMKLWIASIVGLSLGLGANGFPFVLYAILRSHWDSGGFVATLAISMGVQGLALLAILIWGPWVRRGGIVKKLLICSGCWLATAFSFSLTIPLSL
ncbi:MAG: hypothetical protein H7210_08705 [Pyrinomonadaceae bacterium]|nr:hypothetical protein [Phycisphaerales bacterium]